MDVASWLRAGVVGQPKRNLVTGEIVGGSKSTSDVTTDVRTNNSYLCIIDLPSMFLLLLKV